MEDDLVIRIKALSIIDYSKLVSLPIIKLRRVSPDHYSSENHPQRLRRRGYQRYLCTVQFARKTSSNHFRGDYGGS